ncbi:MAG: hypothetical protein H6759_03830 [Candidatus Nomurabacteria bacterium]|nr:MAG: hypothetical protein H6759_03830 [Candidatus Nomurabacteria bacterium]
MFKLQNRGRLLQRQYLYGVKTGRPFNGCDGQPWGVLKYTVNNSPYRMPIPGTNPVKFTDYDPAISPDEPFKNIPEPDEGANGGYWPYESNQFSFNSRSEIAKLYLAPKVAQNETYVILDGTETSGNEHLTQYFTNRLYLPPSMGHRDGNDVAYGTRLSASPYKFEPSHPCNWTSQNNQDNIDCFRDFYRGDMNIDLGHWPHAYLACYTPWSQKDKVSPGRYVLPDNASPNDNSNINLHCNYPFGISNSFPRTDAYRRDPSWNTGTGNYQYIVDFTYKTEYNDGTFRLRYPETYAGLLGLRVRVITSQNMYTLNYKDIASKTSCGIGTSTDVHAWHVFSQNEKTGDITIQNKLINSQCRVTGEDSGVTYLNFRDAR